MPDALYGDLIALNDAVCSGSEPEAEDAADTLRELYDFAAGYDVQREVYYVVDYRTGVNMLSTAERVEVYNGHRCTFFNPDNDGQADALAFFCRSYRHRS